MKYGEREFTLQLRNRINKIEQELRDVTMKLEQIYTPLFQKQNLDLFVKFEVANGDHFDEGYESVVIIFINDDIEGDMLDFYNVVVWKCSRTFLGIPLSKKIFGSKVIGELVGESLSDIKVELETHLDDFLELPD
ncbi:hypothetical protein [Priestia megaterium]|jgi:hypothetical protein|uniref:hypothetical protein n=1 Tax=Priestia megaterium TaxID=1404 RepID=UPI0015DBF5B2|nr:hypothetical protein [Priestia megaterium]QLK05245.1 hypothetical protein BMG_1739 [Priestia megaterium]